MGKKRERRKGKEAGGRGEKQGKETGREEGKKKGRMAREGVSKRSQRGCREKQA